MTRIISSSSIIVIVFSILYVTSYNNVNGLSLSTVIYGPQCRELQLLISKIASIEGIDTSCICAADDRNGCYRLMYGLKEDDNKEEILKDKMVKLVSTGDEIEKALNNANSLVLVCYDTPINNDYLDALLKATKSDELSNIVLLSKMGVTKGGGFFGGGGGNSKLLETENIIRNIAKSKQLDLSIIRAGILKGGGPGKEISATIADEEKEEDQQEQESTSFKNDKKHYDANDYGLNKAYYNTILDIVEYTMTQAHDQFTLGIVDNDNIDNCIIKAGDTIEIPNMIQQMATKTSFDPRPYDTNRIVLASAVVSTLLFLEEKAIEEAEKNDRKNTLLEFSISSALGEVLPTKDEWFTTLSKLASS